MKWLPILILSSVSLLNFACSNELANSQRGSLSIEEGTGLPDDEDRLSEPEGEDLDPSQDISLPPSSTPDTIPEEPQELSLGKGLMIGDSLSSNTEFGQKMARFLETPFNFCEGFQNQDSDAASYAVPSAAGRHYGASSGANKNWLCDRSLIYRNGTGPSLSGAQLCQNTSGQSVLSKLQDDISPDTVVVALGTNSIGFSTSQIKDEVFHILNHLTSEQKCFWILPTFVSSTYRDRVLKTERAILEAIEESPKDCTPISTYDEASEQQQCDRFYVSDGIHHTSCGSSLWADLTIAKICNSF